MGGDRVTHTAVGSDPSTGYRTRTTISSAVLVSRAQFKALPRSQNWQSAGWAYYDAVSELHSVMQWSANSLSRCRLYTGILPDGAAQGDPIPATPETSPAAAFVPLNELFGGPAGQANMLSRFGPQLGVPGESYVVAIDTMEGRRWIVASTDEIECAESGAIRVALPDDGSVVTLDPESSSVMRLWRPHARWAWQADSPTRSALGVLDELAGLSAHIKASTDSRLAGAGLLLISEEVSLPLPTPRPEGEELHDDPAMATLIEAMVTPITDRDAASAVVPILARVPGTNVDLSKMVHHVAFSTPLDSNVESLRTSAQRRLAIALDIPPEVLLGLTDANHWTAWQVEESAIKLCIEPLLQVICSAFTIHYLRPALRALKVPDPDRYVIWYDVSELALRPNRAEQAIQLHGEGMVGWRTVLREAGFSEDDYPKPDEQALMLLRQLALNGIDPRVVEPYLRALALPARLELPAEPPPAPAAAPPAVDTGPADDAAGGDRAIPDTAGAPGTDATPGSTAVAAATPWRLAATELLVLRALELAGKRLLSGAGRAHRGQLRCQTWEIHTQLTATPGQLDALLDGAYATAEASALAEWPCVTAAADRYVRALLVAGQRHDRGYLSAALAQAGCPAEV